MNVTIHPRPLQGQIHIIPSKSQAHRDLICAAFAKGETALICPQTNLDMDATADCLNALGARITKTEYGYHIEPIESIPGSASLLCRESGSTLRFLLPIVGALGVDGTFHLEGRLPQRPLSPLWEEMERMGCSLTRPTESTIRCCGKLKSGCYSIDGGISSQFITGLMFALPLIEGESELKILGKVESKPYIHMTQVAIDRFSYPNTSSPGNVTVEGDWSNGAFFLAANALGSNLEIMGLDPHSPQGDRAAAHWIKALNDHHIIDCADIPDLVPILSIVAAANEGAEFTNIRRLRLKESDRVDAVIQMITGLGGSASATDDRLVIHGTGLVGGTVDSMGDHRIAMAAAIGSITCSETVTILGADAVSKSYPLFWEEYGRLGGNYEQHLR